MGDFSSFFKKKGKKKKVHDAEGIRSGFKGTVSVEEQMRMLEEAQDKDKKKKGYQDGGVACDKKKSYFSKLKEKLKK